MSRFPGTIVRVKSKDEYNTLMHILSKQGYKWEIQGPSFYEDLCVRFTEKSKMLHHSLYRFYTDEGHKVTEFDDFIYGKSSSPVHLPDRMVIRVDNRDEFTILMVVLERYGCKWGSGSKPTDKSADYIGGGEYPKYIYLRDHKLTHSLKPQTNRDDGDLFHMRLNYKGFMNFYDDTRQNDQEAVQPNLNIKVVNLLKQMVD